MKKAILMLLFLLLMCTRATGTAQDPVLSPIPEVKRQSHSGLRVVSHEAGSAEAVGCSGRKVYGDRTIVDSF